MPYLFFLNRGLTLVLLSVYTASPGLIYSYCLAAPVSCFPDIQHLLFLCCSNLWSAKLVIIESQRQIIKKSSKRGEIKDEGMQRVRMGM